ATVLISTYTLPALIPAMTPLGPAATSSSAAELVSMESVTSAVSQTARGESPQRMPLSISHCAFERVRLKPVTVCPFSSSRLTMRLPITPNPMYPRFAILCLRYELSLGLELVVSELAPGLGEGLAFFNGAADLVFHGVDLFGNFENFVFVRARNRDNAIGVTAQQIAGMDTGVAYIDRAVRRFHLDAVFARAHGVTAAIDRITEFVRERHVAAGAIDHGPGDAARVRYPSQDVSPNGGVFTAAVVEHDDVSGRNIIDVIADRTGRFAGRAIENCESAARQAKAVIQRLNSQALAGDAEPVHGIAERRGIEL